MKSLLFLASLAVLTLSSGATAAPAAPARPPLSDRASLWYSPLTGSVGVARGTGLTDVRTEAHRRVGTEDASEVAWTTARGFAAVATFLDDRGRLREVHVRGLLTEAELLAAVNRAAAAKGAVTLIAFARTWVGWGESLLSKGAPPRGLPALAGRDGTVPPLLPSLDPWIAR